MLDLHKNREDKQIRAQSAAKANSAVECQPNTTAPLLRDEKARRDWVERELDICCQVRADSVNVARNIMSSTDPA